MPPHFSLSPRKSFPNYPGDQLCFPVWMVCTQSLGRVQLFATLQTITCKAPLSIIFPGKNTAVKLPFSSSKSSQSRDGTSLLMLLHWWARFFTTSATWGKPQYNRSVLFSQWHLLLSEWFVDFFTICFPHQTVNGVTSRPCPSISLPVLSTPSTVLPCPAVCPLDTGKAASPTRDVLEI